MNIEIFGKDYEITKSIEEYILLKLKTLEKFFEDDNTISVNISKDGPNHKISVNYKFNNHPCYISQSSEDLYKGIDELKDRMYIDLQRKKEMLLSERNKHNYNFIEENKEKEDIIVKKKHFNLKPMFLEEAILQMNMLKHSFFVFLNAETDLTNVIYRRKDGKIGLIETY